MAGSRRNFQYTADDGAIYLFNADESNIEAVNGVTANIAAGNVNNPGIPRNIRPRRCDYTSVDGARTLRIIAATQAVFNAPPNTIGDPFAAGENLTLVRVTPERRRLYRNIDTGLQDGDSPL